MVDIKLNLQKEDLDVFARRVLPIVQKFYEDEKNRAQFQE